MAIEHVDITDPEIHEPKGVATASAGQVYAANGAGSGAWTDSHSNVHAQMNITGNTTAKAMSAAADATLNTDTDYVKMTGAAFPWVEYYSHNITFSTDKLTLTKAGYYLVSFWGTFKVAAINTFMGVKYAINDAAPYSTQKLVAQSTTANDYKVLAATSIIGPVAANDTLSLYLASTNATNITPAELGLTVVYIHS